MVRIMVLTILVMKLSQRSQPIKVLTLSKVLPGMAPHWVLLAKKIVLMTTTILTTSWEQCVQSPAQRVQLMGAAVVQTVQFAAVRDQHVEISVPRSQHAGVLIPGLQLEDL